MIKAPALVIMCQRRLIRFLLLRAFWAMFRRGRTGFDCTTSLADKSDCQIPAREGLDSRQEQISDSLHQEKLGSSIQRMLGFLKDGCCLIFNIGSYY